MGMSRELGCAEDSGVYLIEHTPTGSGYVGSSFTSVMNRFSWHKSKLKHNSHSCEALQELWNRTDSSEWEFIVLESDTENDVRERENFWMGYPRVLLNTTADSMNRGRRLSEETKAKQRASRARYLEDPNARLALSNRAREQHKQGRLGRQTWKKESA